MSLEGAARAYRTLLRIDPNSADVHRALGEVYRSQGRLDAALAEFMVARLIDPDDAVATAAAGQTHLEAGRPDEALPLLRRAVELDSVLPDARYALGTSLVRLGRIDEGRQELDVFARLQAEALAQERLAYETNLRRLEAGVRREEGAHDEAAALWAQVVERAPDAASDRIELGLALTRIGRDEHAVAQFLRALALDADADVHGHLAAAYERLGRLEESREQQALHERWKGDRVATLGAAR
jgi:tetratricopeptide (TPR) repeat protein